MRICNEVSRWITENVQRPMEELIQREETRCRRESCNWFCICCNKWFCFLVVFIVKVVVWVTVTVTKLVTELVCFIVSVILDIISYAIGLIMSIPVIGGIIRAVLNWVTDIILRLISLPDLILTYAGIRVRKKIYVKGIILNSDGEPLADESELLPSIELARTIFDRECNVQLIYTGTCVTDLDTPQNSQSIICDWRGFFRDLLSTQGSYFEFVSANCAYENGHHRIIGYASEILIFIVNDIQPETTIGCSFGATHNYVTVEAAALRDNDGATVAIDTIAHEIAHACNLSHSDNEENLMFFSSERSNTTMSDPQRAWFRSSKHCVFL